MIRAVGAFVDLQGPLQPFFDISLLLQGQQQATQIGGDAVGGQARRRTTAFTDGVASQMGHGIVSLFVQDLPQFAEQGCQTRMIGAIGLFVDHHRTSIVLCGPFVLAPVGMQARQQSLGAYQPAMFRAMFILLHGQ